MRLAQFFRSQIRHEMPIGARAPDSRVQQSLGKLRGNPLYDLVGCFASSQELLLAHVHPLNQISVQLNSPLQNFALSSEDDATGRLEGLFENGPPALLTC